MAGKVNRLFEQFAPKHYELTIDIDREAMTFAGQVKVEGVKVGRPSKRLTLHQKGLKIASAKLTKHDTAGRREIEVSRVNTHQAYDEVRIHSSEQLLAGDYTIELSFSGRITNPMHGIYPCYFNHDGKAKKLIATQFESHHAREAFPCIDEPEAKATFDLTLVSPKGEPVLANTPIKKQVKNGERVRTSFERSPKMSTYLLAFVFGEMHSVSAKTKDGVLISSWATVAQPKAHLKYANSEAVKCLEFFTDYFQTPFPLPKLDQVALPDFDSLAMENWGLITYREVGLLADPINRSLSGEQLITLVIAHEVSHQWFGNLVTMRWWDDLWLNESFASIMENIAPDKLHPDWHQWEDFTTGRVLSSSHRDIYKNVQPISVKVKHPDEILTLFDPAIVYAKGARLLSMLLEVVGEEAFRAGLKSYFAEHAYANTTRADLWKTMSKASGMDVDKLMTPWIEQSGQPRLNIKREASQLRLSQKRFLMDGTDNVSLWPIPLLADKDVGLKVLDKRTTSVNYKDAALPVFNLNGSGHYVVSYDDESAFDNLKDKIVKQSVSSISRITILNDMLLLARAGDYELTPMLEIVRACYKEPRDAVWAMLVRIVNQAQVLIDGDETTEEVVRAYKRSLAEYWFNNLGWDDKPKDDPNTKHLRSTALALSLAGENKAAIKEALKRFKKAGKVEKLAAEQRAMIATAAVRFGESSLIERLMTEYTATQNPEVKGAITVALCSTRDKKVAQRIIDWGLNGEVIRQQDIDHWYAYLMRNHYTRELAWRWLLSHWSDLIKMFGDSKHMEYFIWYSSGPLSTNEWQAKFVAFFKPKLAIPAMKRNILIAFSEIEARVGWRKREEAALKQYFMSSKADPR